MKRKPKNTKKVEQIIDRDTLVSFGNNLISTLRLFVIIPLVSYWWTSCVFYFGKVLGGYELPDNYRVIVFLGVALLALSRTPKNHKSLKEILEEGKK